MILDSFLLFCPQIRSRNTVLMAKQLEDFQIKMFCCDNSMCDFGQNTKLRYRNIKVLPETNLVHSSTKSFTAITYFLLVRSDHYLLLHLKKYCTIIKHTTSCRYQLNLAVRHYTHSPIPLQGMSNQHNIYLFILLFFIEIQCSFAEYRNRRILVLTISNEDVYVKLSEKHSPGFQSISG